MASGSDSDHMYCLNVTLKVKPDRRDEFLECIKANQRGTTTTEPRCISYCWGEDPNNPNTFHFNERYVGRAGFEAHTQAPHFKKWEEFAATAPLTESPTLCFFYDDAPAGAVAAVLAAAFAISKALK